MVVTLFAVYKMVEEILLFCVYGTVVTPRTIIQSMKYTRHIKESYVTENWNCENCPLVEPGKIILSPFRGTLALAANFVQSHEKTVTPSIIWKKSFQYWEKQSWKQVYLLKYPTFNTKLTNIELTACSFFKATVKGFLGNRKDTNYVSIVNYSFDSYKNKGWRMLNKIHFFTFPPWFLPGRFGCHKLWPLFQDIFTMKHS